MDTADVVVTARVGTNSPTFAAILAMHVPVGSTVADVTFGKGTFWKDVRPDAYRCLPTDLKADPSVDLRRLPYDDGSIDAVVLDPPYMEGFFRPKKTQTAHTASDFRDRYALQGEAEVYGHGAVLRLYADGGREANRVLRPGGVLIVKCQDEVSNHRQHLTHVEIINDYATIGYYCKDLFVVVRRDTPHGKRMQKQEHARKNHSYFLVFIKDRARRTES